MNGQPAPRLSMPRGARVHRPRGAPILVTAIATALMMAALTAAQRAGAPGQEALRFLCAIPVGLAAYRPRGMAYGLGTSGFFGLAFLWQMLWGGPALELLSAAVFLTLFAYICAAIAASLWAQDVLTGAFSGSQGLLARATDLREAAAFIEQAAREMADVDAAALLLKSPLDGSWQALRGSAAGMALAPPAAGEPATLAWWLAQQGQAQTLNEFDADPRFIPAEDAGKVRSLLAYPLREGDGDLAAMLALLNKRDGPFLTEDREALALLAAAAEEALEQAGMFARTDETLARRSGQLAALQRAARELNAALEARALVQQIAAAARDLTGADAALAVSAGEQPAAYQSLGAHVNSEKAAAFLAHAARSGPATGGSAAGSPGSDAPALLADADQLLTPIVRGDRLLGVIALARRPGAFDAQDARAVAALADHAAVALDNARLFAEVRAGQEKLGLIVETLADGLLTTDRDGVITAFNPAAEALTGRAAQEAIGRPFHDVLGCAEGAACPFDATLAEGRLIRDAAWILAGADGTEQILSVSAAALPGEGDGGGMVMALRDVTEREMLERLQRELTAAFSHGLRTPLSSIIAAADLLLADADEAESARLAIIRAEAERLADFTQRTLDLQRLDSGNWRLELRPIPAAAAAEAAIARAGRANHDVRLDVTGERAWAWGDEAAVQTVLDNLLENAIKYSPAGQPVVVTVSPGPAGFVTIAVLDRGPGIPEAQRERVFERFYRLDGSDAQRVYGYGLGLYIARRLVEQMGGEICAEARPGGGSRFAFTLPAFEGGSSPRRHKDTREDQN